MSGALTVHEIAAYVRGIATGDLERSISGVSSPSAAGRADLVFIDSAKHQHELSASSAGAAILPRGVRAPDGMSTIYVDEPFRAMMQVVDLMIPRRRAFDGVSSLASIGADARVAPQVGIGPFVFIGDRVAIGRGTELHPGATIGADSIIGEDCVIHSGVHIYHDVSVGNRVVLHSGAVIGADGFGYVRQQAASDPDGDPVHHGKVRQLGRVVIEDDVEIGANATIDRATFDATRIGRGTKIDNLVTVGHNCTIGRHCIVIGQAGISGSTVLGNYVVIAGQAGLTDHLTVGVGVSVCAQRRCPRTLKTVTGA
jgi:UDP-3-O-[3-hydroxymyristoyl] glucosamine N-acyltransferase